MSILGIGAPEFLLILLLVVIILGPERARDAGLSAGRFIKRLTTSEFWRELVQAARFMQQLPQNLVRMAELEEITTRLNQDMASVQRELKAATQPLEAITPSRLVQEPLRSIQSLDQDLRQAISGDRPAPALTSGPAEPPPAVVDIARDVVPQPPGPAEEPEPFLPVDAGPDAEEEMAGVPGLEETIAPPEPPLPDGEPDRLEPDWAGREVDWPIIVHRLDEIERRLDEFAGQLQALQSQATVEQERR